MGYRRLKKISMFRLLWARPTLEEAPLAPQQCLGAGTIMAQIPFGVVAIGPRDLRLSGAMPHTRAEGILFQEITQRRERVWRGWVVRPRLVQPQGVEARGGGRQARATAETETIPTGHRL